MKKAILIILLILMLVLSACSSTSPKQTPATEAAATETTATMQSTSATNVNPPFGNPPVGTPPSGAPEANPPIWTSPDKGTGSSNASSGLATATGAYTQNGGIISRANQAYRATIADESAILITNAGTFTLINSAVTTSGNTSSQDNSSFYGLNAGVLATSGSTINLSDSTITTSGTGANGAFVTGSGSSITLTNVTIRAASDGAHAVMATQGGSMTITNVDMITSGGSSSAIATDRGGGTINVTGGSVTTSGANSAGIYSTGNITVTNGTFIASGAEAAVIEGANSITLANTSLTSTYAGKWGVMIYQSMSGDAHGSGGTFTMTGGSLAYTANDGPLFYLTNSMGTIILKGVNVTAASGTLVKASAGNWGNSGSNGGIVTLNADGQTLTGNLVADSISSIATTLENGSTLTGSINSDNNAQTINLTLDGSSTWTVTADSFLTCLTDSSGISGATVTNIIGNGHTVYYVKSTCSVLGGQTYSLKGGGRLEPEQ